MAGLRQQADLVRLFRMSEMTAHVVSDCVGLSRVSDSGLKIMVQLELMKTLPFSRPFGGIWGGARVAAYCNQGNEERAK